MQRRSKAEEVQVKEEEEQVKGEEVQEQVQRLLCRGCAEVQVLDAGCSCTWMLVLSFCRDNAAAGAEVQVKGQRGRGAEVQRCGRDVEVPR